MTTPETQTGAGAAPPIVPPAPPVAGAGHRSTRRALIAAAVVVVPVVALLWQGLGNATVYFKSADEAVAERDALGTRRFRLEGIVLAGSTRQVGDAVEFTVAENGTEVDVVHRGDPPELFKDGIPVVLEGRWEGGHFASDLIMVRHSSEYREDNPERVKDYPIER